MFEIPVSSKILGKISSLDEFRGRWSRQGLPSDRLKRMREAALIQSVAASCRLGGIRVSDAEVAGLLRGESIPLGDAADLQGYHDALLSPLPNNDRLLTIQDLAALHAMLRKAPDGTPAVHSPLRQNPLIREEFTAEGKATGRVYTTLPSRMIEEKLDELLTWMELELRERHSHPVLVIGTFILALLAISPFEERNGRLARLLIGHLLQRAGYPHIAFASVEREIEPLRSTYQDSFDRAQTRLWNGEGNLEPWLEFFLELIEAHRHRVAAKMDLERAATDFPPLQQAILEAVREHGVVGAGLLIKATNANRNTLKDNLRKLVQRGVLEKTGQRRGTLYRLPTVDRALEP